MSLLSAIFGPPPKTMPLGPGRAQVRARRFTRKHRHPQQGDFGRRETRPAWRAFTHAADIADRNRAVENEQRNQRRA